MMLSDFVTEHRVELIARCRARVTARTAPRPAELELERGIPLFLDHLAATLRWKQLHGAAEASARQVSELTGSGVTVAHVVRDYVDACEAIRSLASERGVTLAAHELQILDRCLDEAIAEVVEGYGRLGKTEDSARATKDLGFLSHELRSLLCTAALAFDSLQDGSVAISGSTGAVVRRCLTRMTNLVDRSLAAVRLNAGIGTHERIRIGEIIEEVEVSALMEAKARGCQLTVETGDLDAVVEGDPQILASIISNLVQNAFKFSHDDGGVILRTQTTADHVLIEVEDRCGGLPPGAAETLFLPYEQRGTDRSGLGLGLAICLRGVEALGGALDVRDLPGEGCVFSVELPRAPPLG